MAAPDRRDGVEEYLYRIEQATLPADLVRLDPWDWEYCEKNEMVIEDE